MQIAMYAELAAKRKQADLTPRKYLPCICISIANGRVANICNTS